MPSSSPIRAHTLACSSCRVSIYAASSFAEPSLLLLVRLTHASSHFFLGRDPHTCATTENPIPTGARMLRAHARAHTHTYKWWACKRVWGPPCHHGPPRKVSCNSYITSTCSAAELWKFLNLYCGNEILGRSDVFTELGPRAKRGMQPLLLYGLQTTSKLQYNQNEKSYTFKPRQGTCCLLVVP
jgi:hypothetical protein